MAKVAPPRAKKVEEQVVEEPQQHGNPEVLSLLNGMPVAELNTIIKTATQIRDSKLESEKRTLIKETKARFAALGVALSELVSAPTAGSQTAKSEVTKAGTAAPVKYRHGDKTWAGRGRIPLWLSALEAEGRNRTEFLVDQKPS